MITDSEESRMAVVQLNDDMPYENVVQYCPHCDEEYQVPEDIESCIIRGRALHNDAEE